MFTTAHSTIDRWVRALASLALFVGVLAGLALPGSAAAASCSKQVVADWSDNGRIDRVYPLRCYQDAIDSLPTDLRDYTNAGDVIKRALTSAVRTESVSQGKNAGGRSSTREGEKLVGTADPSSMPIAFLVVAAMSLAVLATGSLAYLSRRRRARLED